MWRERRRVLVVLALVEALAVAVPVVCWSPLSRADFDIALLLASLDDVRAGKLGQHVVNFAAWVHQGETTFSDSAYSVPRPYLPNECPRIYLWWQNEVNGATACFTHRRRKDAMASVGGR